MPEPIQLTVASYGIKKILDDLYDRAKKKAAGKIKFWNIDEASKHLYREVRKVRLVKTLWQIDKAVDLNSFYCESHIIINNKRSVCYNISSFGDERCVLIKGIAGQGKSTLLRYLCSKTLSEGKNIPIFIELRKIINKESLTSYILQFISQIGINDVDKDTLNILLASGKIIIFLDGFDEIVETEKNRIYYEIENLSLKYDHLKIIVSSRPESDLELSSHFRTVELSPPEGDEYKFIIHKIASFDESKFANELITRIESNKSKVLDLLCTPLLITLLVMSYKSFQEIPQELSEFYDSILQLLLQRHDGSKPGFKRIRLSQLNDKQFRNVFEKFCYTSKTKSKSTFSIDNVYEFSRTALSISHANIDPLNYIQDINKVTCLLLKEGTDYRFIHKSVQEYYAASYIKNQPDPVAKKFYEWIANENQSVNWAQELKFLSEIDLYRYNKYYYLPIRCKILGCDSNEISTNPPDISKQKIIQLLGDIELGFAKEIHTNDLDLGFTRDIHTIITCEYIKFSSTMPIFSWQEHCKKILSFNYYQIEEKIKENKISPKSTSELKNLYSNKMKYFLSLGEILNENILIDEFLDLGENILNEIHFEAKNSKRVIEEKESVNPILHFEM